MPTVAYQLRATIANEGIHSVIEDEHIVSVDPICAIGEGGIKLKVSAQHFEEANQVIRRNNNTPILDQNNEIISCPTCQLTQIENGYTSNIKTAKGIFLLLMSVWFSVYPLGTTRLYKCKKCNKEFQQEN